MQDLKIMQRENEVKNERGLSRVTAKASITNNYVQVDKMSSKINNNSKINNSK